MNDKKSLEQECEELSQKELDFYEKHPEVKMPVVFPIRELGAKIHWPEKV